VHVNSSNHLEAGIELADNVYLLGGGWEACGQPNASVHGGWKSTGKNVKGDHLNSPNFDIRKFLNGIHVCMKIERGQDFLVDLEWNDP